eukprot:707301-Pyramimonas_sp.AAC.1
MSPQPVPTQPVTRRYGRQRGLRGFRALWGKRTQSNIQFPNSLDTPLILRAPYGRGFGLQEDE